MNAERPVKDIMSTQLVTVYPNASAKEVFDIFNNHNFHHLPVVEKGELLVGIISKEDFFKVSYILPQQTTGKTWTEKQYQSLTAKDFMTTYPMTLDPDDTIGLAADIFLSNKFHALPVVEDNQLLGIITSHDLLRYGYDYPQEQEHNSLNTNEMFETDAFREDDNDIF
ncbi:MAG TPA: CBS domain-containing protein [Saprospiraceae bacterium]|nr:CBS domain-containing protein [Saprospiraceae bacterium]HMP14417.1 CBS domain-containing protein [Saprospiraceae bacterium]